MAFKKQKRTTTLPVYSSGDAIAHAGIAAEAYNAHVRPAVAGNLALRRTELSVGDASLEALKRRQEDEERVLRFVQLIAAQIPIETGTSWLVKDEIVGGELRREIPVDTDDPALVEVMLANTVWLPDQAYDTLGSRAARAVGHSKYENYLKPYIVLGASGGRLLLTRPYTYRARSYDDRQKPHDMFEYIPHPKDAKTVGVFAGDRSVHLNDNEIAATYNDKAKRFVIKPSHPLAIAPKRPGTLTQLTRLDEAHLSEGYNLTRDLKHTCEAYGIGNRFDELLVTYKDVLDYLLKERTSDLNNDADAHLYDPNWSDDRRMRNRNNPTNYAFIKEGSYILPDIP